MKAESKLRGEIARALRARGAYVRVVHSDAHGAGALDLDVVYRSRAIKLEVKTPDNKRGLTALQKAEIAAIRKVSGIAEEVRSVEQALGVLDDVDANWGSIMQRLLNDPSVQ